MFCEEGRLRDGKTSVFSYVYTRFHSHDYVINLICIYITYIALQMAMKYVHTTKQSYFKNHCLNNVYYYFTVCMQKLHLVELVVNCNVLTVYTSVTAFQHKNTGNLRQPPHVYYTGNNLTPGVFM